MMEGVVRCSFRILVVELNEAKEYRSTGFEKMRLRRDHVFKNSYLRLHRGQVVQDGLAASSLLNRQELVLNSMEVFPTSWSENKTLPS